MTHTHTQPDPPQHEFEVVAVYNFSPSRADELLLTKDEKRTVLVNYSDGWYLARNQQG